MSKLSDELKRLQGNQSLYAIALEYARLKDGEIPSKRRDKYFNTIRLIIEQPDKAQLGNLLLLLKVLGVDGEAALLIATSQHQPRD
ncbi:MAG: hypothetical protein F6K04_01460 [Leptolyngbya sp. SIO4C5]|nr:hypothetical protein [Leptolyngbya sp. SIO4C5]